MGSYPIRMRPEQGLNRELIVENPINLSNSYAFDAILCANTMKSHYIARMQTRFLQAYHQIFDALEKPLLYAAPWWLDAVCGVEGWDVVLQSHHHKPDAALAYHKTSIRGISALITPPLTQWMTVLSTREISDVDCGEMLSMLPDVSILDLTLKSSTKTHLEDPRFPIDVKYSYILPYEKDQSLIRKGYSEGLRRNLRKAAESYSIESSNDVSGYLDLCKSSYRLQQMKPPHWLDEVVPRVYKALISHQCGELTLASYRGDIIAGVLTAWDMKNTYYLSGGRAEGEQAASAHALLLDQAIQSAQLRQTAFDFEGSMHPGIASFFQSFGARPMPYWHIKKYQGLGKIWSALR